MRYTTLMNLLFWGLTISVVGKVLVVCSVLFAHSKLAHEHRIDRKVIRSFHTEFVITVLGLILIIGGYFMEISFYQDQNFLTCTTHECRDE